MAYQNVLHPVLFAVSICLLILLLFRNLDHFDIAGSKNNALTNELKSKIDTTTNINAVKLHAKHWLDVNRQNRRDNSAEAVTNTRIVLGIIALQIVLWIISLKKSQVKKGNGGLNAGH